MKHFEARVQLPRWANFVAQDESGEYYAFENQPTFKNGSWTAIGKASHVFTLPVANNPKGSLKAVSDD